MYTINPKTILTILGINISKILVNKTAITIFITLIIPTLNNVFIGNFHGIYFFEVK